MRQPELDDDDTARLSTRSDVPPEMLRALQALKAEGPSRRTMEQVASRLGSLLDAPAPVAQPASWLWRGLGARAVAIRVGVAALTIGTAAVWLRPAPGPRSEATQAPAADLQLGHGSAPPATEATSALPTPVQPATPPVVTPTEPAFKVPESRGSDLATSTQAHAAAHSAERASSRARTRRPRTASAGVRTSSQPGATSASTGDGQTQAALLPAERPEPEDTAVRDELVAPTPDAGVARAPAEAPEVRQPSEVELMLGARRLAVRDPRAAQRLLQQHAARFPEGVLTPEREVLAIEVLRALGQTAEAEQRLSAFRARYPNSMHLRRLSTSPATPAR